MSARPTCWCDAEANEGEGKWTGHDVPDFQPTKSPDFTPEEGAQAEDALAGTDAFIMQADGKAWLYAPSGLTDGALLAYYEPEESPFDNPLYGQRANPEREIFRHKHNRYNLSGSASGSDVFPYVFTTYRLTEHHTAGGMSRTLPYLSELQPEFFCEVSPELAAERQLEHLGWATITTARGVIEARVLVTARMTPLTVQGRTLHQSACPTTGEQRSVHRRRGERAGRHRPRPERAHSGNQGGDLRHPAWAPTARAGAAGPCGGVPAACRGR